MKTRPAAGGPPWCWTHVTQPLCTDGSALNNVVRELSREAAARGIRSAVAASDNRGYTFDDADFLPVDFTRSLGREYLTRNEQLLDAVTGRTGLGRVAAGRLYRPVAEALDATSGPVIVHDGLLGAAGLVAIKERHPDRPLYLYVHNNLSRSYARRELRRFLSRCEAVVCVSDSVRRAIAARVGDHPVARRLVVVLNGVDTDRFSPADPDPPEPPSLLFVGMMTEFKGPHLVMEALRRLHDGGIDCTATFLGSSTHAEGLALSPYEEGLHAAGARLGPQVRLQPFVPNSRLPDIYRRHHLCVVPSQFEDPCPLVLFEALASGLATLATRRGGIPEVGRDAVSYFDDAGELARLLEPLLSDPAARSRAGQAARDRALELPWSRAFDALHALIGPP